MAHIIVASGIENRITALHYKAEVNFQTCSSITLAVLCSPLYSSNTNILL